jgi:hemerythrin-like metal-binding protein
VSAITWSELMGVGVPELDADHKTLVGLINLLQRSIGDDEEYATLGTVLKALEDYSLHHFAREEEMLRVAKYPALGGHARAHHELGRQVGDLKERYDDDRTTVRAKDCLAFLHKWLIDHICSTDMDYRSWLVGHVGAAAAAASVSMTAGIRQTSGRDWGKLSILVVDDNRNFCEIMRTILGGVGVGHICDVTSVAAAQAELHANTPDVVVTDWRIGGESGIDLIQWIRAQPGLKGLPILILSGHGLIADREIAMEAGADDFLTKPVSARGLLMCLARLISR